MARGMTIIEIRPFRNGWQVYKAPGVEPIFCEQVLRLPRKPPLITPTEVSDHAGLKPALLPSGG